MVLRAQSMSSVNRWAGPVLLMAALVVGIYPYSYQNLSGYSYNHDSGKITGAGYISERDSVRMDRVTVRVGEDVGIAMATMQTSAAANGALADRRGIALLLAVPGAYLLGRRRREPVELRPLVTDAVR